MNLKVSEEFGQYFARLPLKKAPHIVHGNALKIDWREVVLPERLSYLLGNPPFLGKKEQTVEQKAEVIRTFAGVNGAGVLDYVASWYRKATEYMAGNPAVRAAFVSTNSITQGEQVGVLWPDLFRLGVKIHFAHRTFQWSSEARGKAAVHCVIIGFGLRDVAERWLFDYETPKSEPHAVKAKNINPYLVDGPDVVVAKRTNSLSDAPEINKGSEATDFGHLIFSREEKHTLSKTESISNVWLKRFVGGEELINGLERWCVWLVGVTPNELRQMPTVLERVELVRKARLASGKARTREWAASPVLFSENRQPKTDYLGIPKVSSERRNYLPIAFLSKDFIASGSLLVIPGANFYHFGILSSTMHNAWMRAVCGRMKSDYQYSAGIVYNNFPWPELTDQARTAIEAAAQGVLDARAKFLSATLADLYDPLTMPPELVKAHQALDRAVDAAYGKKGFASEAERVAFLFERYQQLVAPLVSRGKQKFKK